MPGVVLGILHLLTHLICENTLPILDKEANVQRLGLHYKLTGKGRI